MGVDLSVRTSSAVIVLVATSLGLSACGDGPSRSAIETAIETQLTSAQADGGWGERARAAEASAGVMFGGVGEAFVHKGACATIFGSQALGLARPQVESILMSGLQDNVELTSFKVENDRLTSGRTGYVARVNFRPKVSACDREILGGPVTATVRFERDGGSWRMIDYQTQSKTASPMGQNSQ